MISLYIRGSYMKKKRIKFAKKPVLELCGVTLLELLLVVALAAVIAPITYPLASQMQRREMTLFPIYLL